MAGILPIEATLTVILLPLMKGWWQERHSLGSAIAASLSWQFCGYAARVRSAPRERASIRP